MTRKSPKQLHDEANLLEACQFAKYHSERAKAGTKAV